MIEIYDLTISKHEKESEKISFYQCGLEHCAPGHSNGPRIRFHTSIHVVLEGKGKIVVNKQKYSVHGGQAFLIPADVDVYYCADFEEPWKYCWIDFFGAQKEAFAEMIFGKNQYVKDISCGQEIYEAIEKIVCKVHKDKEEAVLEKYGSKPHLYPVQTTSEMLLTNATVFGVLSLLMEEEKEISIKEPEEYIDTIKKYIDNYFLEINEVSEIAEMFHLHRNYLTSLFQEKYHISPKKYLVERKINYASYLLRKTDYTIKYIAQACGFSSLSAFGKTYKKYMNVSPGEYRRNGGAEYGRHVGEII